MRILLLLGPNGEYLDYKKFINEKLLEKWLEDHEQLILENIAGDKSLKERLKLCKEYFPFAGRIQGFEVIDLDEDNEENKKYEKN